MPTEPVTFAAGRGKPKATAAVDLVGAAVGALTGQEGWNGTQNGRKGFQPGNKFGSAEFRNRKVAGAKQAHRAAHQALTAHTRARTLQTPAGRAALRASTLAARELQQARAEHQVATRDAKNAAARDRRAAARAARSAKANGETLTRAAHQRIEALRRGAVAGDHDGDAIIDHVDKLARGTTAKELHEAAARAGISYEGKRKQDAVDAIKNHVYDAKLAADDARAAASARIQSAGSKGERVAAKSAAGRDELARQAAVHQAPTGRPPFVAQPEPRPRLPRPFVPLTPRPSEGAQNPARATPAVEPPPGTGNVGNRPGEPQGATPGRSAAGLAEHIERHASAPMEGTVAGRRDKETMRAFDHGGHRIYFNDTPEGKAKAVAALQQMEARPIPEHVARHTRNIYLTTNEAQREHQVEGMKGGRISGVANGRSVSIFGPKHEAYHHAVLAHEIGHNFAKHLYGGFAPAPGSDFRKAIDSDEPAVSRYGRTDHAEDFATSVQSYYENRDYFREHHPRRHAVIDRLMKDPSYGG